MTSTDVNALVIELKRLPEARRLPELSRRSREGSFEHSVASAALGVEGDRAKIAAVNDVLAEVEYALQAGAGWPSAGIRIALFGSTLLGVFAYLGAHEIRWALAILGTGGAAALGCVEAGRAAKRGAKSQRKAIDALIAVALGHLTDDAPDTPRRRSRRRAGRG